MTRVTHVRSGGPTLIVGFEAFTTPEQVAEFRGGLLQVPRGDSPALPSDQYYQCDLIGMVVQDEAGTVLGQLERFWLCLIIRHSRTAGWKRLLIPAAKQIDAVGGCRKTVMTVRLPEGFGDLNMRCAVLTLFPIWWHRCLARVFSSAQESGDCWRFPFESAGPYVRPA